MIELILYILVFIILSGIFALIDAAVLSVSHAEIETMVRRQKWGAKSLAKLKKHMTRAVVVIVLFTNIINILGPILAGNKAVEVFDSSILGFITMILTFGTIIFSEIIPKSLGVHYSPRISRLVAPVLYFFTIALFPLIIVLEKIAQLFERGKRKIGTEEQIRSLIELGWRAGYIEQDEKQIINCTFKMNDKDARQIMTPKNKIFGLNAATPISEALNQIMETKYSRYPVFDKSNTKILGYVLSREMMAAYIKNPKQDSIGPLILPLTEIKSQLKTDEILMAFQKQHIHIAAVKENKTLIGIITLEDVLEELVGEIEDEKDKKDCSG